MSNTVQCQNPLPVGASGSKTVRTKLLVPAGGFDQCSSGDWFWPVQPKPLKICAVVKLPPERSLLSSENEVFSELPQPGLRAAMTQARIMRWEDISISVETVGQSIARTRGRSPRRA